MRTWYVLALLVPTALQGAPFFIDFESFSDFEPVTNQIPGVTFSNTTALQAGVSLNEFEFPPASGSIAAFDDFGPMELIFDMPITDFFGRFTYTTKINLLAYDSSNLLVDSVMSMFDSNLALSGDPGSAPSETLGVSSLTGISRVVIQGDLSGGSFVGDDFRADAIPEPGTLPLLLGGLVGVILRQRFARRSS